MSLRRWFATRLAEAMRDEDNTRAGAKLFLWTQATILSWLGAAFSGCFAIVTGSYGWFVPCAILVGTAMHAYLRAWEYRDQYEPDEKP